jgi:deoxyribose-phosphate aldolase
MTEWSRREVAMRALKSLDLTNLDDDCAAEDVEALAKRAFTPYGPAAAICVWPRFVQTAKAALSDRRMPVCTVVNFPKGGTDCGPVVEETKKVRVACGRAKLKVILETGVLADRDVIQQATAIAIAGGADFIKTCTGKTPGKATVSATRAILRAIQVADRPVGFKVSGGVRTVEDAGRHLSAVRDIMGDDWITPQNFRVGASSLLDDLLLALKG